MVMIDEGDVMDGLRVRNFARDAEDLVRRHDAGCLDELVIAKHFHIDTNSVSFRKYNGPGTVSRPQSSFLAVD